MEPNNFEKNVQHKLDELKIPPSGAVWTNIEKRIEKRRGKRLIFILFFVFLFLFSGGYWLFNSTKNNTQQQNHPLSNLLEKNNKPALQADNLDSSLSHHIVSSGTIPEAADTFQGTAVKIKAPPITIKIKASKTAAIKKKEKISPKGRSITGDKNTVPSRDEELKSEKNNKLADQDNRQEVKVAITETIDENKIPDQAITTQNKIEADLLLKKTEEKSTVKQLSQDLQKHKWILGVTLSGGRSFLSNSWLDINNGNNSNSDYSSMPNSGVGNSGSGAPSRLPAKTINSTVFIGGAFVEKSISEKTKISLGINYKYFSTLNKTGTKIDSVQMAYNSATYTNSHRNNFNYLELPVSLKFQLTDNKSLPVYWLAGINISQLISSNALQFKSASGIYYKDNSLFHKTQWGLSTGFFATLFSKRQTPVNIGPYFYYNASRISNEGLYKEKHFNFIGVKAEILFNKK